MLGIVPNISTEVPLKVQDMVPQALSNSLWAAAHLQEAAPEVLKMVPVLAKQIPLQGS